MINTRNLGNLLVKELQQIQNFCQIQLIFFNFQVISEEQLSALRKKCPNTEFSWSIFSRIRTEYEVSLRIQSECVKIPTRKTPYLDTFYAAFPLKIAVLKF